MLTPQKLMNAYSLITITFVFKERQFSTNNTLFVIALMIFFLLKCKSTQAGDVQKHTRKSKKFATK